MMIACGARTCRADRVSLVLFAKALLPEPPGQGTHLDSIDKPGPDAFHDGEQIMVARIEDDTPQLGQGQLLCRHLK